MNESIHEFLNNILVMKLSIICALARVFSICNKSGGKYGLLNLKYDAIKVGKHIMVLDLVTNLSTTLLDTGGYHGLRRRAKSSELPFFALR